MMDMIGKTLATIGAAWLWLLFALVLFDYVGRSLKWAAANEEEPKARSES